MRRYNKGWKYESARHGLAAKGVKTGSANRVVAHIYQKGDVGYGDKLHALAVEAKRLVESGATPSFHLVPASVSPNVLFRVVDEKDYEKFGVTDDYPFIEAQVLDVPIDKWADAVGLTNDDAYILYLGINSNVTDLNNAASDALMSQDDYEFQSYWDGKASSISSMDMDSKKLVKAYESGKLEVFDRVEHGDLYYFWFNKSEKERYQLANQIVSMWKEAELARKTGTKQSKLTELKASGKKPYFIDEPFGLPWELQPAGKFRTDAYIDKQGRKVDVRAKSMEEKRSRGY